MRTLAMLAGLAGLALAVPAHADYPPAPAPGHVPAPGYAHAPGPNIPQAPDACGPGYYAPNCCGLIYGPNYCLYPPFMPFQGMIGPPGGGGRGGPGFPPAQFIPHPFARSPRDYFMYE